MVCGTDSGDLLKFVLTYDGGNDDINLAMVGCAIKKVSARGGADQGQKVMSGKFQGGIPTV